MLRCLFEICRPIICQEKWQKLCNNEPIPIPEPGFARVSEDKYGSNIVNKGPTVINIG